MSFETLRLRSGAVIFALLFLGFAGWCLGDWYVAIPVEAKATFVGGDSCIRCHQESRKTWEGSDHDRAMEIADEESVLGDFDDTQFTRHGITTRFFRQDGKYMVNTEGPDGEMQDFEIKYTFGVRPLQQYMVEFPDGRLQVLTVSWDVDKKEWFMVTPPDVPHERILPGDPLHWTGIAQNWNTMCAECHSTNLQKNYDLATNSYHTTYTDIDVNCESCHGPGSLHIEIAESHSLFWDRNHGYGLRKLKNVSNAEQLESCASCHSRRSPIHVDKHDGESYLDDYSPALLESGLYFADGQILDEVYVYGSFLQSKMYHNNVKCTDCHNPHSLELKFDGNKLCAQCHQPGKYDTPNHHHHNDTAATQCVSCHMQSRTYMGNDVRHDHSFRIPRPDLTVEIGVPNTCNNCHTRPDQTAAWAAEAVKFWYGPKRPDDPHFGLAFAAAREGKPEGLGLLRDLLKDPLRPAIVRATAVRLLANYPGEESDRLCRKLMSDKSPLVRASAIESLSESTLLENIPEMARQLYDTVRLVRSAAARRLVGVADQLKSDRFKDALEMAVAEYREGQDQVLDRAASHLNLAALEFALGDSDQSIRELRTAIQLEPYLTGPRQQLAELLDPRGEFADEVQRLREEEVANLRRDAAMLPESADIQYRMGMLLYLLGEKGDARQAFEEACELSPHSLDNWMALALICESQRDWDRAYEALEKMYEIQPDAQAIRGILKRIQDTRAREEPQESQNSE